MKYIFYIDSMQKGGANRVMANLTDYFAKIGNEVILINDILPDINLPEYEVNRLVKRIFLNKNNSSRFFLNMSRVFELRRIIKHEKAGVVISFMGPPNVRMLISTLGLKCKKVVSVRNDPYIEYGKGIKKCLIRNLFRLADGCVFQTKEASQYFPMSVQKKSRIIFNPVDELFYKVDRSKETRDIVTVGRFERQKNHRLLIEAFSKITNDFPKEKLIIYGDGSLRNELEKQIEMIGLGEKILLPGRTNNVPEKLSRAKIFVLSSDFEGMPNALMEAMALGIPVISTDCPCGGPNSLIENDTQGILVPTRNVDALANAIRKLLENPVYQNEMSIATKNRARDFVPLKIYNEWNEYLKEV